MIGVDRDAAGQVADQIPEPHPQLVHRGTVEADHEDAVGTDARDPKQPGATMDHHPRLAGPGTRQHQEIALLRCGDDRCLSVVAQILDDLGVALARRGPLHHLRVVAEVVAPEVGGGHGEIPLHVAPRTTETVPCLLHVASHRVDLKHALLVVVLERSIVAVRVTPTLRLVPQANRHRLPEDRQPLLQRDDVVFVQVQERFLDRIERVPDLLPQPKLSVDRTPDLLQREPHQPNARQALALGVRQ